MLKISAVTVCLICFHCVHALPHCRNLNLPETFIQRNTVNVIYTMASSCKLCAEKASMLPNLKASLQRAGVSAKFIVAVSTTVSRLYGLLPHVSINKRQAWRILGEQNDHFYIIDRCGRMVYEIINPWSSLQMPFLRGAIVATQYSHPCGLCPQDYAMVEEEKLKIYPPIVEESKTHPKEEIPLGIVMRLRHVHLGDPNIYNHIVMVAQGIPGHHQHLPHETNTKLKKENTFSLNILEDNKENYSITSVPSTVISDISVSNKDFSVERTNVNNSIKNLGYNSLRMANETQLLLNSGEFKNSSSVNSTSTEENTEISFTEQSEYPETYTENSANEEQTNSGDYIEDSSEQSGSMQEDNTLTSDELAEKESLKEHYRKILDWVKYDN